MSYLCDEKNNITRSVLLTLMALLISSHGTSDDIDCDLYSIHPTSVQFGHKLSSTYSGYGQEIENTSFKKEQIDLLRFMYELNMELIEKQTTLNIGLAEPIYDHDLWDLYG